MPEEIEVFTLRVGGERISNPRDGVSGFAKYAGIDGRYKVVRTGGQWVAAEDLASGDPGP